jgi:hypothetical protein
MSRPGLLLEWPGRLILTISSAVLLSGCGGDDPVPPGAPEQTVADALPGTPPEVEEALLTTDDLGDGWVDLGAVPLDERGFAACPETGVITGGEDRTRLGEAQSTYAEDDPAVPTFGVSISLWESPDVAAERFATFASMTSECQPFEEELPGGGTTMVSLLPRDAPRLGDEAVGVVIEADQADGPTILRDSTVVRIGDVLVLTEGLDRVEDDPEAERQQQRFEVLTEQAVEKAASVLSG